MNKETRIKSIYCVVQFSLGGEMEKLVITDVTKYLIELMKIDSE